MHPIRNPVASARRSVFVVVLAVVFAGTTSAHAGLMMSLDSGSVETWATDAGYSSSVPVSLGPPGTDSGHFITDLRTFSSTADSSLDYTATNEGDTAVFRLDAHQSIAVGHSGFARAGNLFGNEIVFTLFEPVTYTITGEMTGTFADPVHHQVLFNASLFEVGGSYLYSNSLILGGNSPGEVTVPADPPFTGSSTGVLAPGTYGFQSELRLFVDGPLVTAPALGEGFVQLTLQSQASAVPEPSSLALLGTGLFGLIGYGTRRWKSEGVVQ